MTTKQEREEAKKEVKMWLANDWNLSEETPEFFLLKKNTQTAGGHLLVFLLLGWWTLGVANIAYYLICKSKKKIIK